MNGGPAQLTELLILTAVSLDVVIKLRLPPVMVVLGEHGMVRAHVPEASVNEDRDPGPREHDVRPTREGGLNPEAQTEAVERPSESQLGPRVASRHTAHLL